MAAKASLLICIAAALLLVQSAYSACVGGITAPYGFAGTGCGYNGFAAPALAYDGIAAPALAYDRTAGFGCGYAGVASTGGGLPCASASPVAPVGVSLVSENVYEGALAAGGNLPFLGTVGIKGVLPTAGAGAVSYGCGNSRCAVGVEEGSIATGIAPHAPGPYAPYAYDNIDELGYGYGASGYGYGVNGYGYGADGYGCGVNGYGCGGIGFGRVGCGYEAI